MTAASSAPGSANRPPAVGELVAVNVGLPRDVAWRGRTVHTGVWKEPVDGPRMVRHLNVDGDGQGDLAGHGGPHRAVLVYQLDSYALLGAAAQAATTSGTGSSARTSPSRGCRTTRCASATATRSVTALFEVSQPRVTCYRVGLRLGEPQLPALLVAHRRPGFYLRVLREGVVRGRRPDRQGAHRARADDRRRGRRPAVPARPRPARGRPGAADAGAEPRLARAPSRPCWHTDGRRRPGTSG